MSTSTIQQSLQNALSLMQSGQLAEAEAIYRRILAQDPNVPDALQMLGVLAYQVGNLDAASRLISAAIARAPGVAEFHNNLGLVLTAQHQHDAAIKSFNQALAIKPQFPAAHNNLGAALKQKGELDAALASFRQALMLQPNYVEAINNLATVLHDQGRVKDAIALYNQAIKVDPRHPQAHNNLGNALKLEGRAEEAIACFRRALEIQPNLPGTRNNLGNTYLDLGRIDDALAEYGRAVALQPHDAALESNRLFAMHLLPDPNPAIIFQQHRRFNELYAPVVSQENKPHLNETSPQRRLKIGYVSPDFREHSVAYFFETLLNHHGPRAVEVFCYADLTRADAVTARLRQRANHWHDITGIDDDRAAQLIREHQIDILVDLAGHTAGNRLALFARKPAPVQITWLGYPDTTGLAAMDYRITDAHADPPGMTEHLHSEQLIRLPHCFLCFTPPADAPPVAPLPAQARGHIAFGCFNGLLKITEPMIEIWSGILHRVQNARLLLKSRALADAAARTRIQQQFTRYGIAPARIDFRGWIPTRVQHFHLYNEIDITLDTHPYNGTASTCESLWMGVPVVSLAGQTHVSRVGASLLANVGLKGLIARSSQEYVEIAVRLAGDIANLQRLRRGLRQQVAGSALTDASSFARDMEGAYCVAWKEYIAGKGASGNP